LGVYFEVQVQVLAMVLTRAEKAVRCKGALPD
jgi:hypothetical protein